MNRTTTCPRCLGTGKTAHKHVENGRCFQCEGTGRATLTANVRRAPLSTADAVDYCRNRFVGLRSNLRNGFATVEDFCSIDRETGVCGLDAVRDALNAIGDATTADKIRAAFAGLGVTL